MNLVRRTFLVSIMGAIAGWKRLGAVPRLYLLRMVDSNPGPPADGCSFFNETQAHTVGVISDLLIPPDEFPGGKDAGVVAYIDRALSVWAPQHRWDYRIGLDGLDESSNILFHRDFVASSPLQQATVLEQVEKGTAPGSVWKRFRISRTNRGEHPLETPAPEALHSGPAFFALLLRHAMEGYYGDPKYGGNRDGAAWQMVGYPGMPLH